MRMSLRWKVTLALVAFGLIPAGIVAAVAYTSTEDFKAKQNTLIVQAAAAVGDRVLNVELLNEKEIKLPAESTKARAAQETDRESNCGCCHLPLCLAQHPGSPG